MYQKRYLRDVWLYFCVGEYATCLHDISNQREEYGFIDCFLIAVIYIYFLVSYCIISYVLSLIFEHYSYYYVTMQRQQ